MTKRILITGAHGFLGRHVLSKLEFCSEIILTLGQNPKNDLQIDLANEVPVLPIVERVIHLAGKAHVNPINKSQELDFFQVNEGGMKNLCKALEKSAILPKSFVFVSTVAVYGKDEGFDITEDSPLLGDSAYALSKIRAEKYLMDWGNKFGVKVLILRLPLVAGFNPPGNLGRMLKAIKNGRYLSLGGGKARKSVVLAADVADLIIKMDDAVGIYNLTDGDNPSFRELEITICHHYSRPLPIVIPGFLVVLACKVLNTMPNTYLVSKTLNKMIQSLTFDDNNARRNLGWNPRRVIDNLFENK